MDKKGSILDLVIFVIAFFLLLTCVGIIWGITSQAKTQIITQIQPLTKDLQDVHGYNATLGAEQIMGKTISSYSVLSWITIFIFVGMILNIIISSALIKSYPFMFVAYIFVVVLAVIFAAVVSNTYEEIYQNPSIASGFTGLLAASWLMLNMPYIITVVGFIAGIFLFINIEWVNY